MSIGTPVAADIPGLFDVIINGKGYLLLRTIDTSLPFRTQRALYTRSATFLERTNTTGDYGDNQQDFWQTASMRDWSLGEDQKFFRTNDDIKKRQFWLGSNINVTVPGQLALERSSSTITFAAASSGAGAYPAGAQTFTSSTTNLYEVSSAGAITDRGVHGAGGTVTAYTTDGTFLYLSGSACTKIRRYDLTAHTFADFNATQQVDSLTFLNNTVYGCSGGTLYNFDTGGVKGDLFDFKTGTGTVLSTAQMKLDGFGGKVLMLRYAQTPRGPELWQYDGSGVSKLSEYPPNFRADDFCVSSGIVFMVGVEGKVGDGYRTAIYYYANGSLGRAWANTTYSSGTVGLADVAPYGDGVVFTDVVNGRIRFYDLAVGGVSSIASYTPNANSAQIAVANQYVLLTQGTTSGVFLFATTKATTGYIQTSIVDFESSLTKLFRGVIVDWVPATDGNGGTIDIAYQIDAVDGAYTSLQTGASSGVEYQFSGNPTGRGVSAQVTLNKGTSTLGPTVKRIYFRAAPVLQSYRQCEYILDCSSRDGRTPLILNDNETAHPLDGLQQTQNISTAIASATPIPFIDRLGSYTGLIEPDKSEIIEVSPEEYICRIWTREV